ncbi:MAG: hypothetical protein GXZ05_11040 [Gammaproteobacteria bacterium]|nr:hypothetical protein [Gammaproteobacteria bacterium]
MTIDKAFAAGIAGDKVSRTITGTDEVSAGRTTVAAGAGAAIGAAATGGLALGASAVGATALAAAAAPVVIPVAVFSAIVGGISSLFE